MMSEEEFVLKALQEQGHHDEIDPKIELYWKNQYSQFKRGARGPEIHDLTFLLLLP